MLSNKGSSTKRAGLMLCSALMASLLAGCGGLLPFTHKSSASAADPTLTQDKALVKAEAQVAKGMEKPQARVTLAQAYLEAGRFQSAVTTFEDAMVLGDKSKATVLGLALAYIGSGHEAQALGVLAQWQDVIPRSDLGLAIALADEPAQAIEVLSDVVRSAENSATARQNLAYAYALAGRWVEARLIASRDLAGSELDARLQEWAQFSRPDQSRMRVAGLLGTTVKSDPGQPVALALQRDDEGMRMALAVAPELTPALLKQGEELPAVKAALPMVRLETSLHRQEPLMVVKSPSLASVTRDQQARAGKDHLVQLGSFTSEEGAKRAWGIWLEREPKLKGHSVRITQASVHGRRYFRLGAVGFDRRAAEALCDAAASFGDSCLALTDPCRTSTLGTCSVEAGLRA